MTRDKQVPRLWAIAAFLGQRCRPKRLLNSDPKELHEATIPYLATDRPQCRVRNRQLRSSRAAQVAGRPPLERRAAIERSADLGRTEQWTARSDDLAGFVRNHRLELFDPYCPP